MDDAPFASPEKMAAFIIESSKGIAALLQSLSHEKRLEILAHLAHERQSFAELQDRTGFQASVLGNHLAQLSDAGLTRKIKRGVYDITPQGIDLLEKISEGYLGLKIREQQRLQHLQALIGRYTSDLTTYTTKGDTMTQTQTNIKVRIVELPPFRYVAFHAMGKSPEPVALTKLKHWAQKHDIYHYPDQHPIYGFNNPDPQQGKEEYGYEFWIVVDNDFVESDVEIKDFSGGRYAVTTTRLFPLNEDNVIPA